MSEPAKLLSFSEMLRQQEAQATPVKSTPVNLTPVELTSGVKNDTEPLQKTPDVKLTPDVDLTPVRRGFLRVPHHLADEILPTLKPAEQIVLFRLFRLSHGFGKLTCTVSLNALARAVSLSESATRVAVRGVEARGYIRVLGTDNTHPNRRLRGLNFEVLPSLAAPVNSIGVKSAGANSTGVKSTPIIDKYLTDTHNTGDVCVCSRFTLEECRKYADHLHRTEQGIVNPGGYATKIYRSGEADIAIAAFLAPVEASVTRDVSACPDCHGTGFWEPGGIGKGVAKCKHDRLPT
jgi:hypothetical protein